MQAAAFCTGACPGLPLLPAACAHLLPACRSPDVQGRTCFDDQPWVNEALDQWFSRAWEAANASNQTTAQVLGGLGSLDKLGSGVGCCGQQWQLRCPCMVLGGARHAGEVSLEPESLLQCACWNDWVGACVLLQCSLSSVPPLVPTHAAPAPLLCHAVARSRALRLLG